MDSFYAIGSEAGRELVKGLPVREPSPSEIELGQLKIDQATERMGRTLNSEGLKQLLFETDRASVVGRGRQALSGVLELHDGMPDMLLLDGDGFQRPCGRHVEPDTKVGILFHASIQLHNRRARA